jgi:predicted ATP-dependent Lon-type protease
MWLNGHPQAFDWTEFIKTTLVLEGNDCSAQEICLRENEIRKRVTQVLKCDANLPQPIQTNGVGYDVLVSNFCAESATDSMEQWCQFVENITSLIRPGGRLIMSMLKGASSYGVGTETFPAVNIMEDDLIDLLIDVGFDSNTIDVESVPADRPNRHYQGLIFVTAIMMQ